MAKINGQQQFSRLWTQFQTTNSHLFQGGGQLKTSLSTGDAQQLLTTVTQDSPDDAQLYGVHCLMTEHTDTFEGDDLEVLRLELAEYEIDFAQFEQAVSSMGLANAAKRFAPLKNEVFVIQSEPGKVWDLMSCEGIIAVFTAIARHHFPDMPVSESVGKLKTHDSWRSSRYVFGDEKLSFGGLLLRYSREHMSRKEDGKLQPPGAALDEIKMELGWVEKSDAIELAWDGGKPTSREEIISAFRAIVQHHFSDMPVKESIGKVVTSDPWIKRSYLFGGRPLGLPGLLYRFSNYHMPRTEEGKQQTPAMALNEIKQELGWVENADAVQLVWHGKDLTTRAGIIEAFAAIARHHFPGMPVNESVGKLSMTGKWLYTRYSFGGEGSSINVLTDRYRARHMPKGIDGAKPTGGAALHEIKQELGWVRKSNAIELAWDGGDLTTREGIIAAFEAIARHHYPTEPMSVAVGHIRTNFTHRYSFDGEVLGIQGLLGRYRKKHMSKDEDGKPPTKGAALDEIRHELGWISDAIAISWDGDDLTSRSGLIAAFAAIARHHYPDMPVSETVSNIGIDEKWGSRRYSFGGKALIVNTLLERYRIHHMPPAKEGKPPTRAAAIWEIRRELGWVEKTDAIELPWDGTDLMSRVGIIEAFAAITRHHFPDMPVSEAVGTFAISRSWTLRRYSFAGADVSMQSLINRYRRTHLPCGEDGRLPTDLVALNAIKKELGWVDTSDARELAWDGGDLTTREGIIAAVKAIARHHYPGLPPSQSVGKIRRRGPQLSYRYSFGSEELSLRTLLNRYRKEHMSRRGDGTLHAIRAALAEIRGELGWVDAIELAWDGADLATREGIVAAVKAIAVQDAKMYSGAPLIEALEKMKPSPKFLERRYLFGQTVLSLGTLLERYRVATIDKGVGSKLFPRTKILRVIKMALGWQPLPKKRVKVIDIEAPPGAAWDFQSEQGLLAVIDAIVRQDSERYVGDTLAEAVSAMTTSARFLGRRYRFRDVELRLGTLLDRLRSARGLLARDTKMLPSSQIIEGIKLSYGWAKPQLKERFPITAKPGRTPWDLQSEEGVLEAIRATIEQDEEIYGAGPFAARVELLSSNHKFLRRKYQFGELKISLETLLKRIHVVRGHRASSKEAKRLSAIIDEVKRAFGWKPPASDAFVVQAAPGMIWDLESRAGIIEAIRAIMMQDEEIYTGRDLAEKVDLLSCDRHYLGRRYRFGDEELSMNGLLDRMRTTYGLHAGDRKLMSNPHIISEIKRDLGGLRYATEDDVREFASRHKLDPVISLLSDAPSHLRDFLEIFFQDELDGPAATHLVRTFSGLKLYTEIHQPRAPKNNLEILVGAMLMRQDSLSQLAAHEYERALRLLQYVMGRHFEEDLDTASRLVDSAAEQQGNQDIKVLLADLSAHYRKGSQYSVNGIETNLFLYQRLGVQYLVDHDNAILADDPGLGKTLQALAAAEKLREMGKVKKVLVVAPARMKSEWKREVAKHLKHVDKRKIVKIDGDVAAKSQQIEDAADADYIILNYEFLRNKTPEELAPILKGLDLLIVDEAQKMSNPDDNIQQAKAMRDIQAPRKWLLTATPYYSHPEHVFSLLKYLNPDQYGSFKEFREAFSTDVMGLRLLHGELEGVMLRRSIAETLGEYQPGIPIERQGVKMPRREVISPVEEGHYDLSRGQVELLRELSQDIRGWMVRRGYSKKMTHFTHLKYLYHATVDPALLGEDVDSPMYDELDRVVMKRLAQGKKVLIYAHHQKVVRRIRRRYEHLGAVQFNGDLALSDAQKEANLKAFEEDPDVPIMVAGIESGGTGLNIKAADVIVNVERTLKHSSKIQSEGRPQRLSPESPKESYEIVTLVPRYPKELIEAEADPAFREFMEQGTVSEILEGRLADLDRVYHLVMGGLVTDGDAQQQSKKLLVQGFSGLQKVDIDDIDTPRRRKAFAAAGAFYQLWDRYRDDRPMQARVRQLATLFHKTTVSPQRLANALADVDAFEKRDFDWLMSPFSESNKYLRDAAVRMLSPLIKLVGDVGLSLSDVAGGLASPSSKVARVILPLMTLFRPWENETVAEMVKKLLLEIEELPSSTRGQALTSLMAMATSLSQSGNGRFRDFVLRNAHVFGDEDVSIIRRTNAMERLALFRELSVEGYEEVVAGTYADIDELSQALKERQWQTLANEFGLEWDGETEANIARLHGRWGDFRPLMGLLGGMQREGGRYDDEIAQLKEVFVHAVRGDLHEWRNVQASDRTSGNKIEYLAGHPDFWRWWSREDETRHDEVIVEAGIQRHILGEEYEHLVRLLQLTGGEIAQDIFSEFARSGEADRKKLIRRIDVDKRVLAKASRKRTLSADDVDVAQRYGVGEDDADIIGTALRRANRLFKMLRVLSAIVAWSQGMNDTDLNVREVINVLRQMALGLADSVDETDKQLREQFDRMRHFLEASGKERTYKNVRVYDTDDPNIIMRLGALAPDMVNCFNHHGNPSQNHVLTGALGSRNFRVVIVEVDGRIRAVAPVKVRKTDDERPVIFLERGLFSGRYNFEREMLGHLEQKKARRMELQPIVARQIMKPRPEDVRVYSTGSYGRNEYAEALFGVRESDAVYHSARIVFDPAR